MYSVWRNTIVPTYKYQSWLVLKFFHKRESWMYKEFILELFILNSFVLRVCCKYRRSKNNRRPSKKSDVHPIIPELIPIRITSRPPGTCGTCRPVMVFMMLRARLPISAACWWPLICGIPLATCFNDMYHAPHKLACGHWEIYMNQTNLTNFWYYTPVQTFSN